MRHLSMLVSMTQVFAFTSKRNTLNLKAAEPLSPVRYKLRIANFSHFFYVFWFGLTRIGRTQNWVLLRLRGGGEGRFSWGGQRAACPKAVSILPHSMHSMKGTIATLLLGAVIIGLVAGSAVFYVAVPPRTVVSTSYSTRTVTSTVVSTYTYTHTSHAVCLLPICPWLSSSNSTFSIVGNVSSAYPVSYVNINFTG